jgi:tetratricopeptide (TPR) repeat protein
VNYLVKLVFPFNLSAFYPYPIGNNDTFPVLWYAFPLLLFALGILVLYSLRKTKLIFFSTAFFVVTIALVLQWLPVGKAIMADRYSYLPSLALFFLAADGLYILWKKNLKWMVIPIIGFFTVLFSFFTYQRSEVWESEIALWNDVLTKHENVQLAYLNRGIAWARMNNFDKAIGDLSKAIQIDFDYSKDGKKTARAYFNRGNLYLDKQEWDKALHDFTKSVELNPQNSKVYYNRGNVWSELGETEKALADYSKAIELDPEDHNPYINRALAYGIQNEYDKALKDFDRADQLRPNNPETHFNRGLLFMNRGEYDKSIQAFSRTIELNPRDAEAYFNRGYILITLKKYKEATTDFSKLISLEPADPRGYYYRGLACYYSADRKQAEADMARAAGMGYQPAMDFLKVLLESK